MTLGELIATLENELEADATLVRLSGLPLYADVAAAAARNGDRAGTYAAAATRRFAAEASGEQWLGLMSAASAAHDPGAAALQFMLRWAVAGEAGAVEAGDHR